MGSAKEMGDAEKARGPLVLPKRGRRGRPKGGEGATMGGRRAKRQRNGYKEGETVRRKKDREEHRSDVEPQPLRWVEPRW